MATLKLRARLPARGIAQSSSSGPAGAGSTRKRMISFSPERAERPVNEHAARQKHARNRKASESLQLRLEGRTPEKKNTPSEAKEASPSPTRTQQCESPESEPSRTMEVEVEVENDAGAGALPTEASVDRALVASGGASCKKELDFAETDADTKTARAGANPASSTFTSTSVIEDVGLFNCDTDVEFTGGVYGEGTDGKVSAATVRGQKVALKRAKPHDGFPEDEAKRRSAVELHYLRKVRHVPGFVQCLGLCDGIEHTCIALEVMDCKLSDYLRRHGTAVASSASRRSSKCYTLGLAAATSMLRQICEPMAVLHDQVNVAHGDLACRNILLRLPPKGLEPKWEPVAKLSDFGRIKTPASEPPIFDDGFSFFKNCDVGCFAREILYRLLVGEIVPASCTETRSLHKHLQDVVVEKIPDAAREKLGPYFRLFMRCAGWGVRPTFREIADHLDDLEYFETSENGFFPLKPMGAVTSASSLESASFLSPMMEGSRNKMPSSGSKQPAAAASTAKYDTPTTAAATPRGVPANNAPGRLVAAKNLADSVAAAKVGAPKTVNWLKARSVHPGQPVAKLQTRPSSATASTNPAVPGSLTPSGRPAFPKKTPPSAGASRRSLQILNQIQHREQEKKNCEAR